MGFCGTSGSSFMDYLVADKTVILPEYRGYYDEKLIYMPHSYFVNDHKQSSRHVISNQKTYRRAQYGIEEVCIFKHPSAS